ncbi:MAG TPA: DUF1080 domain-containing protein [Planctomycetota bacterium]|jgi:hypothetical protein
MSRYTLILSVATLALLLGCGDKPASKETKPAPLPDKAAPDDKKAGGEAKSSGIKSIGTEWVTLFDGKTLNGWKETDFGGQGKPKVEDGNIVLPSGAPLTGVTFTDDKILPKVDYEVECEAQRADGSDFFCALTFPVKESHASLVLGGWGGSLCGISSLDGEDAANNETTKSINFQNKKWYKVRVRVSPDKIEGWLDDEQIVDANIKDRRVGVRWEVESSRPLGVASYQTLGLIKNLKIRKLD